MRLERNSAARDIETIVAKEGQSLNGLWIGADGADAAIPVGGTKPDSKSPTGRALAAAQSPKNDNPVIRDLLAKAHRAHLAGKTERMAAILEELVEIAPDHANAQYNLGIAYRDLNQIFPAERALRRAVRADPTMVDGYQALADLLFNAKHLLAALTYYEKALELAPNRLPVLHNMAKSRLMMKQAPDVEALCRRILSIDEQSCDAHWQLAWSLSVQGKDLDEALSSVQKGLALQPRNGHCLAIRQHLLEQVGRADAAREAWSEVQSVGADEWQPHKQICEIFHWLGENDKARQMSLAYIERHPLDVDAFRELGTIMMSEGDFIRSQELLDQGLKIAPDNQILRMVKGLNSFRMGRFREGLALYDARWQRDSQDKRWDIPVPEWDGRPLTEKPLVVYSEQGIGDYVMFGVLFSELRLLAKSVIVEVNVRMHRLFQRTYCDYRMVDRRSLPSNWDNARLGAKTGMGDLPLLLSVDMERLPNRSGFLVPDANLAVALRQKYKELFPGKRLIGISWRSGSRDSATIRSIDLTMLEPVLRNPDCAFISLQYGNNTRDLADLEQRTGIKIHWDREVDPLGDMDPFAAQIAALDLVISVDNSTVHFAGALGKPCWVLLPVNSDWRWLMDRPKSIWYDSLDLMRLDRGQGWEDMVQPLADKLRQVDEAQLIDSIAAMCRRCGAAMLKAGRYSDAEGFFRWLLEIGQDIGFAMHGIGMVARSAGKSDDAVGILARAVELDPDRVEYRADYALALNEAGEAEAAYRLARDLTRQGEDAAALMAMAKILVGRDQGDQATDYYARILQSRPDDVEARLNLARLQSQQGEDALAEKNLNRILDIEPNLASARALLGEIALRDGDGGAGSANFAFRFGAPPDRLPGRLEEIPLDDRPDPWTQGKLKRKRLYLRAERDLVEQMLFLPRVDALAQECSTVLAECDSRLLAMAASAFPKVRFTQAGTAKAADLVAARIQVFGSLGDIDLARPAGKSMERRHWLSPDAEQTACLREEYRTALPGRALVGLCWRSASRLANGNRGKLPLDAFAPIFSDMRLGVISVHPGNVKAELEEFVARTDATLIFDPRVQESADLKTLAVQLGALDIVLSVDDMVLALASAMGKAAIKLAGAGEHWSWGQGRANSPWWPGVAIQRGADGAPAGAPVQAHAQICKMLGLGQ